MYSECSLAWTQMNEKAKLKPGGGIFTFCILLLWGMAIK